MDQTNMKTGPTVDPQGINSGASRDAVPGGSLLEAVPDSRPVANYRPITGSGRVQWRGY